MPGRSAPRGMNTHTTAALLSAIHQPALTAQSSTDVWRVDTGVVVVATAAALFLVAGVIRLARWRLSGDPHCALVGSALIVMGALYLPLVGVAEVSGALSHRVFGEAVLRALITVIAAGLVLRSLRATSVRPFDRPGRLLPVLAVLVLAAFSGLAAAELAKADPLSNGPLWARLLSAGMTLIWLGLAVAVRRRGPRRPWSRRAAPLFGALAAAEAIYGYDPGAPVGSATALAVCTGVAGVAVWSAKSDLDAALAQTEQTIGSLSETLRDIRAEAVELTEWRADLVHDATNSVAGLRFALELLSNRQAEADPATATLCQAAAEEVHHLDHLLHRAPEEPCGPFDVGPVVRGIALTAHTLGNDVVVDAPGAIAVGHPGELVVVLKNLLTNAARHAPGAPVELAVEEADGQVRIVCWDHGPGVSRDLAPFVFERGIRGADSAGSGLGLFEARQLMRAQAGDLILDPGAPGARFIAVLPTAGRPEATPPVVARQRTGAVPRQRNAPGTLQPQPATQGVAS